VPFHLHVCLKADATKASPKRFSQHTLKPSFYSGWMSRWYGFVFSHHNTVTPKPFMELVCTYLFVSTLLAARSLGSRNTTRLFVGVAEPIRPSDDK